MDACNMPHDGGRVDRAMLAVASLYPIDDRSRNFGNGYAAWLDGLGVAVPDHAAETGFLAFAADAITRETGAARSTALNDPRPELDAAGRAAVESLRMRAASELSVPGHGPDAAGHLVIEAAELGDAETATMIGALVEAAHVHPRGLGRAIDCYAFAVAMGSERARRHLDRLAAEGFSASAGSPLPRERGAR